MVQDLGYDAYDPNGDSIETLLNKINTIQSQVSSVVTGIDKITGITITSEILQTASTIKISAQHLNLVGAVTITDLESSLQGNVNMVTGWAYNGTTLIDGGHIKTGTVTAQKLESIDNTGTILLSRVYQDIYGGKMVINDINGFLNVAVGVESGTGSNVGGTITLHNDGVAQKRVALGIIGAGDYGIVQVLDTNALSRVEIIPNAVRLRDSTGSVTTSIGETSITIGNSSLTPTSATVNGQSVATQSWVSSQGYVTSSGYGYGSNPYFYTISQSSGTFYVNSAGIVSSSAVYDNTITSSANMFIGASGNFYRSTSSIKYKKDVEDLWETEYSKVLDLRPVWYRSKAESDRPDWSYVGLIAEEVHAIEPRLVHYKDWYTEVDGVRVPIDESLLEPDGVQYDRIGVLLLPIIKRQQQELLSLRNDVELLKAR